MPHDVMKQLQEASTNINDQKLKQSLNEVIQKASQSSESMNALKSIMNALTQGGQELSNSLEKVVYYFEQFESRSNSARQSLIGLGNSFSSIKTENLQQISVILERIENQQQNLSNKINLFPSIENTYKSLQNIHEELSKIQKNASKGINVNVNYSGDKQVQKTIVQGQSFSNGGAVRHSYKPSNTQKAKTGGQFIGKRSGDRQIAFVNAGEAIITQKAIKSGARQVGMGVGSYINSLNSGNISRIKKGRSFGKGTEAKEDSTDKEGQINNLQKGYKRGKTSTQTFDTKDLDKIVKLFEEQIKLSQEKGEDNSNLSGLVKILKDKNVSNEDKNKIIGYMQQRIKIEGGKEGLQGFKDLAKDIKLIEEISNEFEEMGVQIDDSSKKIKTFGDLMEANLKDAEKSINKAAYSLGNFGKFLVDSNTKAGAFAAGMIKVGKSVYDISNKIMKFSKQNTNLNKSLANFNSTGNLFGNVNMQGFRSQMDLTRQQASQLTDTFRSIGVQGNMSFGQIQQVAKGIKEQFGQLDTSLLQQAIKQVKDLPKEQIDVLINGKGSTDDQFNLIANLMEGGNLQSTAQIIAKGGFGKVQGVTPELSPGDKETLAAHARTEKRLDDINASMNNLIPASIVHLAGIVTVGGTIVGIGTNMLNTIVSGINILNAISSKVDKIGHNSASPASPASPGIGSKGKGLLSGRSSKLLRGTMRMGGGLGKSAVRGMAGIGKALGGVVTKIVPVIGKILGPIIGKGIMALGAKVAVALGPIGIAVAAVIGVCKLLNWFAGKALEKITEHENKKIEDSREKNLEEHGMDISDEGVSKVSTGIKGVLNALKILSDPLTAFKNMLMDLKAVFIDWKNPLTVVRDRMRENYGLNIIDSDNIKRQEAEFGKIAVGISKRVKRSEDDFNKKAGIKNERNIDVKKQITILAAIDKKVKMVGEGKFSKGNIKLANASLEKNKLISKVGGSDTAFRFNVEQAVRKMGKSTSDSLIRLQDNKKVIQEKVNKGQLSNEAAQLQLANIVESEVKVYERLINTIESSIAQYEKMPSVIQASIISSINNALNESKNSKFTGNVEGNVNSALSILDKNNKASKETFKSSMSDIKLIQDHVKKLDSDIKQSRTSLDKNGVYTNNLNIDGTINQQNFDRNLENARKVEDEYNDIARKYSKTGYARKATRAIDFIERGTEVTQSLHTQVSGLDNDKYREKKDSINKSLSKDKDVILGSLNEVISESSGGAREELKRIRAELIKGYENVENAANQELAQKAFESLTKQLKNLGVAISKQRHGELLKIPAMQAFLKGRGKNLGAAQEFLRQSNSFSGASNTKMAVLSKQSNIINAELKVFEDRAKDFQKAMDLIYKSAQVLYQDFRAKTAQSSYAFDSSNGSKTFSQMIDSKLSKLGAEKKALDQGDQVIKKARESSNDLMLNQLPKLLSKSNLDKNDQNLLAEYAGLLHKVGDLRSSNPQDEQGKKELEETLAKLAMFQKNNKNKLSEMRKKNSPELKAIQAASGNYNTVIQNHIKALADWKNAFVQQMSKIAENFLKGVNENYNVRKAKSDTEFSESIAQEYKIKVDIPNMQKYARKTSSLVGAQAQTESKVAKENYDISKEKLEKNIKQQKSQLAQKINNESDPQKKKKYIEELKSIDNQYELSLVNLKTQYTKKRIEISKKVGQKINKVYEGQFEALSRKTEGLQIQKDLYNSIGAPFEMILDIERNIIQVKKEEAAIEEEKLQMMIKNGASVEEREKQKLKLAKAQAGVIKAAFGAQRDSLDKMLGKMMGQFEQVGGIFSIDSDIMNARKYGQGYSKNQKTGMIHTADQNKSHNSYQQRIQNNMNSNNKEAAQRMSEGHQPFDPDNFSLKKIGNKEYFAKTNKSSEKNQVKKIQENKSYIMKSMSNNLNIITQTLSEMFGVVVKKQENKQKENVKKQENKQKNKQKENVKKQENKQKNKQKENVKKQKEANISSNFNGFKGSKNGSMKVSISGGGIKRAKAAAAAWDNAKSEGKKEIDYDKIQQQAYIRGNVKTVGRLIDPNSIQGMRLRNKKPNEETKKTTVLVPKRAEKKSNPVQVGILKRVDEMNIKLDRLILYKNSSKESSNKQDLVKKMLIFMSKFFSIGKEIWKGIKLAGLGIWKGIKSIGLKIWEPIKSKGLSIWDGIKTKGSKISQPLNNIGKKFLQSLNNIGKKIGNVFTGKFFKKNTEKYTDTNLTKLKKFNRENIKSNNTSKLNLTEEYGYGGIKGLRLRKESGLPNTSKLNLTEEYGYGGIKGLRLRKESGLQNISELNLPEKTSKQSLTQNRKKINYRPHKAMGSAMGLFGLNSAIDAYDTFNNAETSQDFMRGISHSLDLVSSLSYASSFLGKNKSKAKMRGKFGSALTLLSSGMGLFNTKEQMDENGNISNVWDANQASYSMENLALLGIMQSPLGSMAAKRFTKGPGISGRGMGWGMLAQAGGMLTSKLADRYMQKGKGKNRVTAAGDLLSSAGSVVSDVSLTMATGGVNKAVQGAFDVYRKMYTQEGKKRASNVGREAQVYDTITKLALSQAIFKAGGSIYDLVNGSTEGREYTDVGGALDEISDSVERSKAVNEMIGGNLSGIDKGMYDYYTKRLEELDKEDVAFGRSIFGRSDEEIKNERNEINKKLAALAYKSNEKNKVRRSSAKEVSGNTNVAIKQKNSQSVKSGTNKQKDVRVKDTSSADKKQKDVRVKDISSTDKKQKEVALAKKDTQMKQSINKKQNVGLGSEKAFVVSSANFAIQNANISGNFLNNNQTKQQENGTNTAINNDSNNVSQPIDNENIESVSSEQGLFNELKTYIQNINNIMTQNNNYLISIAEQFNNQSQQSNGKVTIEIKPNEFKDFIVGKYSRQIVDKGGNKSTYV